MAVIVRTVAAGVGGGLGLVLGVLLVLAGGLRLYLHRARKCSVAKKPRTAARPRRPVLAAVAYGEIASSLYFALGVIALYALGFTPWVPPSGCSSSSSPSPTPRGRPRFRAGGAATFVRRAFNDPAGFLTGWALILDYLIVMALAGLFVPHYLGHAIGWQGLTDEPWDTVVGVLVILTIGALRLLRRTSLYRTAILVAGVALASHLLLVGLGFALLFSTEALTVGVDLGTAPTWSDIAFALPVAMLAYTGLETVANLAAETREPQRTLPRSLFVGIGLVVAVSVAIGIVGISAFPGGTGLATDWLRAPLMGITAALDAELPAVPGDALRVVVGLTGVVVLLVAVTTSISGAGRLAYSMGQRQMLPHASGKLNRRTLIAPVSIVSSTLIAATLLVIGHFIPTEAVRFLAGLFSFGVLLAFTAAQLAVIRLRFTEPDLERPFRAPGNVRIRGADVPIAALIGAPLTFAIWIVSLATHDATRIAGPAWPSRARWSTSGPGGRATRRSSAVSCRPIPTSSPRSRASTSGSSSR